ncbi:MAG: hypothetical protein IJX92_01215 [Clostridia bacterium]|nr:hypothetical protein [Clostridia bacterium]
MKETIEHILDNKIIMIVRGVPTDRLVPLGEAVWRVGIGLNDADREAIGRGDFDHIENKCRAFVAGL